MKYAKPELRLEKYTLAENVMAEEMASLPVIEDNKQDVTIEDTTAETLSAFSNVLDFSK